MQFAGTKCIPFPSNLATHIEPTVYNLEIISRLTSTLEITSYKIKMPSVYGKRRHIAILIVYVAYQTGGNRCIATYTYTYAV